MSTNNKSIVKRKVFFKSYESMTNFLKQRKYVYFNHRFLYKVPHRLNKNEFQLKSMVSDNWSCAGDYADDFKHFYYYR